MHLALLTAVAFFGWAIGDICTTIASRKIGSYSSVFYTTLLGVIIFAILIPSHFSELKNYTLPLFLLNIVIASLLTIANLSYVTALQKSNASIVSAIAGSFPAVTVILSVLFLRQPITSLQVIAIVVISIGIILSTLNLQDLKNKHIWHDPSLRLALLAMLCWGSFYAFLKPISIHVGWFWPIYFAFWFFPFVFLYMRRQEMSLEKPTTNGALPFILITAILMRSAEVSFNSAMSSGNTSFVAPVAGSYPILFVLIAAYLFKDPIKKPQKFGIAITLIGIVWLSWLSS